MAPGTRTTNETVSNIQQQFVTKPSLFIATSKTGQTLDGLTFKFRRII
jgi:hypothetical protein